MNIWEQLLLVLGLSMDGFAASVCMGMETRNHAGRGIGPIIAAISGCHVVMLLLGYLLGTSCRGPIATVYPWAAALLLTLLGVHMMREAGQAGHREKQAGSFASIAALSFATSIDATTVGVAFALYEVPAWQTGTFVALVMGSLSFIGAACGDRIGTKYRRGARLAGGVILCVLGAKLLVGTIF